MAALKQKRLPLASGLAHIAAAAVALGYADFIAGTSLRLTGLQFVMPALFIIATHFAILALWRQLRPGFSSVVLQRSFGTAMFIVLALLLGSIFGPYPAYGDFGDVIGGILLVVFCSLVIAVVVFVLISAVRLILWAVRKMIGGGSGPDDDSDGKGSQPRTFDFGSLIVAGVAIVGLSLEDLPNAYSFASSQSATSTRSVDAPVEDVWQAMQTATSPEFPLPAILDVFPRPSAVEVDEGVALGDNRVVRIEGREGAGNLSLRVVERTDDTVRFEVLSDTSPIGAWVSFQTLTYRVVAEGDATRLSVQLDFDRRLAPKWFFAPVMRGAAYLAADVLVRDVAARSEMVNG